MALDTHFDSPRGAALSAAAGPRGTSPSRLRGLELAQASLRHRSGIAPASLQQAGLAPRIQCREVKATCGGSVRGGPGRAQRPRGGTRRQHQAALARDPRALFAALRTAPPCSDREPHERRAAHLGLVRRGSPESAEHSGRLGAAPHPGSPMAKGSRGGTGCTTYPEDNPKPSPWDATRATPPSAAQCRSVLRDVTAHLSGAGGTTLLLLALPALPAGACLTRSPTNALELVCLRLPPAPPAPPPCRPVPGLITSWAAWAAWALPPQLRTI